jgi:hypothetical protein
VLIDAVGIESMIRGIAGGPEAAEIKIGTAARQRPISASECKDGEQEDEECEEELTTDRERPANGMVPP